MAISLNYFLLLFCVSLSSHTASAVNSDGKTLLSLVRYWGTVPLSIQLSWKASDSYPCSWVGVQCDHNNQSVVGLDLSGYEISGQLGPEIAFLKHLKSIDLSMNHFSGVLPDEATELQHLKNLSLCDNRFTGVVPQGLGIKSSLVGVDLSNNRFTGHIPPHLCFGKQLMELNLSRNNFQGCVPSDVGSCSNLTSLILQENNLTGVIPDFMENSKLFFMDLSNNSFSGGIPSSLGNLTNIISVDLSMNKLSGPIPPEIGRLVNLQALNLSHNNLNGELPSPLSNCNNVLHLDVSHNLLNGSIPSSLRSLTELSTLSLSENGFTGNMPTFLFEFGKLSKLQLGGNLLGGNIPATIGSLGAVQNLILLNLSSNMLMGEVPIQLRGLTMLEQIDISCNNLSGSLRFLHDIQSLVFINVSHNHFSGPIPLTLLKFFNSSPTAFAGNPELFVNCLPVDDLNCIRNSSSTPILLHSKNKVSHYKVEITIIVVVMFFWYLALLLLQSYCMGLWNKESEEAEGYTTLPIEIMAATENLSDRYIIGRGVQAIVYKVQLSDGRLYALKKIPFAGFESVKSRMIWECDITGRLQHRNLIKQMEYWITEDYGLILCGYMENGSLHDVLHESYAPQSLEWNIRYKIALGTAQGLSYLHHDCNPRILHRDITSMNILLDDEFEPHISTFGFSKLYSNDFSSSSRMVIGTLGYVAPEIAYNAWSEKSDVYSYGVVLLELITGKNALDSSFNGKYNLVTWVQSVWSEKEEIKCVVDPKLLDAFVDYTFAEHVSRVLRVALRCTEKRSINRPSMKEVVKQLMDACSTSKQSTSFLLHRVMEATENLNDKYIIGRGGQGTVYKVTLSPGMVYAVKKHRFVGIEGRSQSMIREVETIGKVQHPNLIRFKGFWFKDNYGLILYTYMENGSLHDVLHSKDFHQPRQPLEWNIRYQIAVGTAQGLSYLHSDCDPPILHGDIKSKNILLDSKFEPHIADFGLAMLLHQDTASKSWHTISGTIGYIAPENVLKAKSKESDVYAYGVVLLELITGKKAIDPSFHEEHNIVSWVQSVWIGREEIKHVLDPSLLDGFFFSGVMEQEVTSMLLLALSCTRKEWNKRPSMRDVGNQLIGIRSQFEFSVLAGVLPPPPFP